MSQQPPDYSQYAQPPQGQPAYQPGYYTQPPYDQGRPTSVTVLAIFGIVFGGLGLLCKPLQLLSLFIGDAFGGFGQPGTAATSDADPVQIVLQVLGIGVSLLLLIASIGLLSLKPWARKGMLLYAGLAILMMLVGYGYGALNVEAVSQELQAQDPNLPNLTPFILGGIAVGFLLGLIYPLCLFWFLTRPRVKAAFDPGAHFNPYGYR